ncbi:MAG: hypothetical protein BEN19_02715 [Epulopiscium sp. Nuni2H_MBin003]|nr:MAG: hypothetical protein BEN19_02715 [Epulopiscium sp. Nuni2H_MBin003]
MNSKGFTLLECVISCTLLSIVLLAINSIDVYGKYSERYTQELYDSKVNIIYNFLENRIATSSNIDINLKSGIEVTYENEITEEAINYIDCYFTDLDQWGRLVLSSSTVYYRAKLSSSTQNTIESGMQSCTLIKQGNSSIVTIKYVVSGTATYFTFDLSGRGLDG